MLGTRVQWTPILDFQQSAPSPARKVGNRLKVLLPEMRCRVHTNNGSQRPSCARQVHQNPPRLGGELNPCTRRINHQNPFPPTNTTITTLLPFHGLPQFETGFSSLGFAVRLAHADHVASKQISGRVRHWHFYPSQEEGSRHVNHRPSRESSNPRSGEIRTVSKTPMLNNNSARRCCERDDSKRHFTRDLARKRGDEIRYSASQFAALPMGRFFTCARDGGGQRLG